MKIWKFTPSANRDSVLIENRETGKAWVAERRGFVSGPHGTTPPDRLPEDRLLEWLAANAREMEPHELTDYAIEDERKRVRRREAWEAKAAAAAAKPVAPVKPPEPAVSAEWGTW